ncbi:hypothetical protein BGZ57DRAFT_400762 [Hyaloscypha finlandica]|nr:hypothetical protein BGZ57DRAFT_400762 [Hyaloscypha finlandica]
MSHKSGAPHSVKNIAHESPLLKNSPISLNLPLPSTTTIIRATTATTTAKMAHYSCLLSGIKEYAKTHPRTEPPNHKERGALVYSGNIDFKHAEFKPVALKSMTRIGVVIPVCQVDDFVELWADVATFRSFWYPGKFSEIFPHVADQAEALLRRLPLPPFPQPTPAQTPAASRPSLPPLSRPGPAQTPAKETPKSETTTRPQPRPQLSSGGTPSGRNIIFGGGDEDDETYEVIQARLNKATAGSGTLADSSWTPHNFKDTDKSPPKKPRS